jgi:hypothetical protein
MPKLDDGFSTLLEFSENSAVQLWVKEVTLPGISGGGAIDTTTMLNTTYRTQSPKSLISLTDGGAVAAYDPAVYDEILAMVNTNQQITATISNGDTLVFWGWIDEFAPAALVEGEQPTADLTIIPSNQNASGLETGPVLTEA